MSEPVEVVEYDPAWSREFEHLKNVVWPAVEHLASTIEHVGSTSVPGLAAKPILDVDIVVADEDGVVAKVIAVLAGLGWNHRGDLGIVGREAFTRHSDYYPHNLYVCRAGCASLQNHLLVRDRLRSVPGLAEEYAAIKRNLARTYPNDIDGYVAGKTEFLTRLLAEAGMASDAVEDIARANTTGGVAIHWRGEFTSAEANALHAEAFETRQFSDDEWDWRTQVDEHSLGWVTARTRSGELVGFTNVIGDGSVHAWIQDVMVAAAARHHGIGIAVVHAARDGATAAGCEWLHVDFDDDLKPFYFDACGFTPTSAGLIELSP